MPHESKTLEERIFFPAILRKATTMCTEVRPEAYNPGRGYMLLVRHILVHVHVSVKFYMWPTSLVLGVNLPYSVH